jgi:hypothetical protein
MDGQLPMNDEKPCLCIRSFHSSILQPGATPPVQNALHSPLDLAEPKSIKEQVWATDSNWCAERKAGIGAVRANKE